MLHRFSNPKIHYRIAADLETNINPAMWPTLSTSSSGPTSSNLKTSIVNSRATDVGNSNGQVPEIGGSKLSRFAQALKAIENERLRLRNNLQVLARDKLTRND